MSDKKQNGFTLVELLIVISILGILSAAIALTLSLVTRTSTTAMGQNRTLSDVTMAGNWISRDMKNAFAVDNTTGLCSMQCSVGEGFTTENVTYMINNGVLTRTSRIGSELPKTITVAQSIVSAGTGLTCENVTAKYFKLTVTADYESTGNSSITRVYHIKQGY